MREEIASFETAKLAKEKGFNTETRGFYNNGIYVNTGSEIGQYHSFHNGRPKINDDKICLAPTQSLLQKWLREVHNIHLVIRPRFKGDLNNPIVDYSYNGEKGDRNNIFYPTYEEALEVGLSEALTLIKI